MSVTLTLEDDVALVLFELLASEQIEKEMPSLGVAERKSLWAVEGSLERALVAPSCPDYSARLEEARASIVERMGS